MLAAATQGQEQEQGLVQLLELAASVGKGTGGEVRLGAEQGDRRQDGAGDWRRLRKRRCRRGIIKTVSSALANPGHCRPRWDNGTRKGQKLE